MLSAPLALIAELTHRCPLHCLYCSNPLELQKSTSELNTQEWVRVFAEAADLGCLHLHLTGGEPLARADVVDLVSAAHAAGLYTNLITSGIGLSEKKLDAVVAAGLEHIQLSFQDSREAIADWVSGMQSHRRKLELARQIRQEKIAFTVNVVVHRLNLGHLDEIIRLAEELQPDRLEIASVQYYGWALRNRNILIPTRAQVEASLPTIAAAEARLRGRVRIDYVVPDYYARYPKPCMGGWGSRLMLIDPAGRALPCHAANLILGLQFDNIRAHSLDWIWQHSPAFNKFRGQEWMPEPCRSCDRRSVDFGGCRCQAFLLTGDAGATDPVCSLAPRHDVVLNELERVQKADFPLLATGSPSSDAPVYRMNPTSNC